MIRYLMGILCAAFAAGPLAAAEIAYAADGATGEYCGTGYGISVSVSTPATGATVEYAESETGPWSAEPVEYTDACTARPVWFRITAEGYGTVVDSRTVTVTPKDIGGLVWPILPAEGYAYDGTAKEPEPGFGDGDPSILTREDFDVTYEDNVEAGVAKMVFTGKRNYAGRDEQEFEIAQAENEWTTVPAVADWTYGQSASEPVSAARHGTATVTWSSGARPTLPGHYTATFTVPASRNYCELTETVPFTVRAATIAYVADGATGEYCGTGYGISVSVSAPVTGATVEYAESETGPWSAEPVEYTDACTARPVWFRITAEGYGTVVDSRTVTVTPKDIGGLVWPILPAEGYAYDGTAKEPEPGFGDGDPSILTREDFDVTYEDNVEAGTAKMAFTGKRNYAGRDEQEFDIEPAKAWGDGEEPGEGTIPAGGLSKFDATFVYDGRPHTIDTDALAAIEKAGCTPTVSYSLTKEGVYQDEPFFFTDVVTTSFWYKISLNNANYEDYVHAARLTITPRDIALATVAPIIDQDFTGAAVEPVPSVTDGDPSIITADDYTVSYADNMNPGAATLTLTGRGNYTGTKSVGFTILSAARDVVFDALGGRIGQAGSVTQSLARVYGDLPAATRPGYVLAGWCLGVTNGSPAAVGGAALLADADHTLFARWSVAPAASPDPETLYAWEATGGGTARILGFRDPSVRLPRMVLPDTLGGLPVTEIARGAFANSACGVTDLTLPVFCTGIGFRAFSGIATLAHVTFTPVRDWANPESTGNLAIGDYAFAATGLESVRLPASVSAVGNYAFADCRKLVEVTILGRPTVGTRPFRRAGIGAGAAPVVRLDPALAGDSDYRNAILQDVSDAVVRTGAVVEGLSLTGLGVSEASVTVSVSVLRAADWGEVDASALRVEYRASLGDAPVDLVPRRVERRADGSLAVEVAAPGGSTGFFRVKSVQ